MPIATNVQRQVERRILQSGLFLTVHYPAARVAPSGSAPAAAPTNPLTGVKSTTHVVSAVPTPATTSVTVSCLWLDMTAVKTDLMEDRIKRGAPGWVQGAHAVARVAVVQAALNPAVPFGDTVFTGAAWVEFANKRYTVLSVEPITASFSLPVSYYVWLTGAAKQ